jgi:hypothetical protein
MSIPFTQYLRPNGRRRQVSIERPSLVEKMADHVISRGYVFECEELSNGTCSLTVTNDEGDLEVELCRNGPEVSDAVDVLVKRAYVRLA